MAENNLPEGTDSIVSGAAVTEREEELIVTEPTARDRMVDKARVGRDKFSGQAADKARVLGESANLARQGQIAAMQVTRPAPAAP
jgi:hypothetical protein